MDEYTIRLNDCMWKRLDRPIDEVEAVVVDSSGRDFYVNASGAFILERIEKGVTTQQLLAELREASEPSQTDAICREAEDFVQLLIDESLAIRVP